MHPSKVLPKNVKKIEPEHYLTTATITDTRLAYCGAVKILFGACGEWSSCGTSSSLLSSEHEPYREESGMKNTTCRIERSRYQEQMSFRGEVLRDIIFSASGRDVLIETNVMWK